MKAILALYLIFTFSYCRLDGGFQTQEIESFKSSHEGKKVLSYLSSNLIKSSFDIIFVSQQVVAGYNYRLSVVDADRKIHMVKVYSPLNDAEITATRFATVDKGTEPLIGTETIMESSKAFLESYFSDNFDGAVYNIKNFIKFEHAASEQKKDLVILAKFTLEGTDNSVSEVETLLLADDSNSFEAYFVGKDKIGTHASESGCGQYITAINCLLDKACKPNALEGFSKCSNGSASLRIGF